MDMKTIGVGLAALILGFLGGSMISGNNTPASNQEMVQELMQDSEGPDMMLESMMNDESTRSMIEDKIIKADEEMMEEESINEEESMMEK